MKLTIGQNSSTRAPRFGLAHLFIALLTLHWLPVWEACGSRLARELQYTQPGGNTIRLWCEGDQFQAVTETLEGYSVVFVPETRTYCYAQTSADGAAMESTGVVVGEQDPARLGLPKHQRVVPVIAERKASAKRVAWEKALEIRERWTGLKAQASNGDDSTKSPPTFQTVGTKCGLTVLIDFEQERATIPREEVIAFLNGDSYTGYGNNGSVKSYYADVSNGRLNFTNSVTLYITIPTSLHPRSYYNDPTKDCGQQGQSLIRDALNVMKALPNYTNDFLPLFQQLSVDGANRVASANFFVAGNDSGVWSMGLWPHSWAMSSYLGVQTVGGKTIDYYQLSTMANQLTLYAFCHENGHMLCGFPDLYDYGYDSWGGAGPLCMMDYPVSRINPPQFCAYLKAAAGWATVSNLAWNTSFQGSLSSAGTNFNRFYRYRKPGLASEYFLLENRQPTGRDADIGTGGIAVWHIDELGNKDDQNLATNSLHYNFEVTLVQADNRWDLNYRAAPLDKEDCFYSGNTAPGYANAFSDVTSPAAQWWDGRRSGLALADFGTNAETIAFQASVTYPAPIAFDPTDLTVYEGQTAVFSFRPNTTALGIQWYKDGLPLALSSRITNVTGTLLTIQSTEAGDGGNYSALLTHPGGTESTRNARLTVLPGPALAFINLVSSGGTVIWPDGVDLTSTGGGISGLGDYCRLAYQRVAGDFDVQVQVKGIGMKGTGTRAGLMIRQALVPGSAQFCVLNGLLPQGPPCSVIARTVSGAAAQELVNCLGPFPFQSAIMPELWLRLQRQGNRLTAYRSLNGSEWVWLKSLELDLGAEPYVGMVLTAGGNASGTASAAFRHYELRTNTATVLAIFTSDSAATEGTTDTGQVVVYSSRNGPLQAAVKFGGTAVNSTEYLPLPDQVIIPAGTNVACLNIAAIDNNTAGWPKTVEVTLTAQPGIEIVKPSKAAVLIVDNDQPLGGLRRELYPELGGTDVAEVKRQAANPNAQMWPEYVTSFETPTNAIEFGEAVTGYLIPPQTGSYVFYLAADDTSELWLSTNANPAGARLIASLKGYSGFREYLASGRSSAVPLVQGQPYFVRAWHKQRFGTDWLSVAWQLPGGAPPTNGTSPIPGEYLALTLPVTDGLSLTPYISNFSPLSATGSVAIAATGAWTAQSLETWIRLVGETTGTRNGTLSYAISANPDTVTRAGVIVVNGHTHAVIQEAAPMIRVQVGANQSLQLLCSSSKPVTFVLEASNDLLTWESIYNGTFPATVDLATVDLAAANSPVRFYRTVASW